MRLAYVVAKFSANNGKPLPVTVPTVARVYWHDLAGTVDPNVRVTTARRANDNDTLRAGTRSWALPNPRRTNRPLTALAARLTLIHEEGRTGRCPRVLMDER